MLVSWNLPNVIMGEVKIGNGETPWTLLPGVNEVPDNVWELMQKHPLVKIYIDKGDLTSDGKSVKAKGLLSYDVTEAKKIVLKTYDSDLLKSFKETDDRDEVKTAIDAQLKEIASKSKRKSKSKDVEEVEEEN